MCYENRKLQRKVIYVHTCVIFLIYNTFRTMLKIMYYLLCNYLSEKRILFIRTNSQRRTTQQYVPNVYDDFDDDDYVDYVAIEKYHRRNNEIRCILPISNKSRFDRTVVNKKAASPNPFTDISIWMITNPSLEISTYFTPFWIPSRAAYVPPSVTVGTVTFDVYPPNTNNYCGIKFGHNRVWRICPATCVVRKCTTNSTRYGHDRVRETDRVYR